jgi:hypothetical protein
VRKLLYRFHCPSSLSETPGQVYQGKPWLRRLSSPHQRCAYLQFEFRSVDSRQWLQWSTLREPPLARERLSAANRRVLSLQPVRPSRSNHMALRPGLCHETDLYHSPVPPFQTHARATPSGADRPHQHQHPIFAGRPVRTTSSRIPHLSEAPKRLAYRLACGWETTRRLHLVWPCA